MPFSASIIWFFIGVAFLIAELAVPGFILIFFAAGSWLAAVVAGMTDMGLSGQITVFVLASLVLLFTLRKVGLRTFKGSKVEDIDDAYADAKIGKVAEVTRAITPEFPGEVKVMGSFWRAVADTPIEKGQAVVIVEKESADALTFKVAPKEKGSANE